MDVDRTVIIPSCLPLPNPAGLTLTSTVDGVLPETAESWIQLGDAVALHGAGVLLDWR